MFREMRRFKQQLTDEECIAILKRAKRGTLAVNGDDGYPYAIPLNFHYDEENDKIYFHGAGEGHKMDAIKQDDKVSFNVIENGEKEDWWYHVNSVTVFGRIKAVEDVERKAEILTAVGDKYFPDHERTISETEKYKEKVTILELTPEHRTGKTVREK